MNELKLKMAVLDARRKWLPREKVMPGKPSGDDAGTSRGARGDQWERSPRGRPVQWSGAGLPPMGVRWI